MDFSSAFLANFLGAFTAALAAAFPLLAAWAFIRGRRDATKKFWSRRVASASLRVRFLWLMIRGKQRRPEYRSWASAERTRRFMVDLVRNGGKARSLTMDSFNKSIAGAARNLSDDVFQAASSVGRLTVYAGQMSLNEWGNPAESRPNQIPPEDRVDWLMSQTTGDLGMWSVRLGDGDRKVWLSWLASDECKEQFALSNDPVEGSQADKRDHEYTERNTQGSRSLVPRRSRRRRIPRRRHAPPPY